MIERKARALSYDGLAEKMIEVGCPIRKNAIFRIEKGNGPGKPPRHVTVDELVGFARVFDLSLDDLLTPIELIEQARAKTLIETLDALGHRLVETVESGYSAYLEYFAIVATNPELSSYVFEHQLVRRNKNNPWERLRTFNADLANKAQTLMGAVMSAAMHDDLGPRLASRGNPKGGKS
jgi:hypothetical protein